MSSRGDAGIRDAGVRDTGIRDAGVRDEVRGVADGLPSGVTQPAAVGVALVVAAYLTVLVEVTNVVGGTTRLLVVAGAAGLGGVVLAGIVGERTAVRIAVGLLVAGGLVYYFAVPESMRAVLSVRLVVLDVVSLLTGLSVLRLTLADVWVVSLVPVPTFLTCYFAARGRHVWGASVAGAALGFFVLTGDAGGMATLVGVTGVALAVGLDTLAVPGGVRARGETLAVVLAVMLVVSATVTVVPAGAANPWGTDRGTPALESTLADDEELEIVGTARLSPEVRFTAEVNGDPGDANWHAATYDTYTGDGWVRTGDESSVDASDGLAEPPAATRTVESTVTVESELPAFPAPWRATAVSGDGAESATVDEHGVIRPGSSLDAGDTYVAESDVAAVDPALFADADAEDYPDDVHERYTQLPETTPDRVGERTEEILDEANAETPYEQAAAIEAYLIEEYDYSLSVEQPDGDVADAFLFEMDAGYCTYFATTMVAMLRSQGVPASFATGYGPGETTEDGEEVVRGQDAHAWVQVYIPEYGWAEFDPTPSDPRQEARDTRLADARASGAAGVDTDDTSPEEDPETETPTDDSETPTPEDETDDDAEDADDGADDDDDAAAGTGDDGPVDEVPGPDPDALAGAAGSATGEDGGEGGDGSPPLPDRETAGYWLLVLIVASAGVRHLGWSRRLSRAVWLRVPGRRRDPETDAHRAFEQLEYLLARTRRPRRQGETPRDYLAGLALAGVDDRVRLVVETHEQATYGNGVSREEADAARRAVRELALDETPGLRRLRNGRRSLRETVRRALRRVVGRG